MTEDTCMVHDWMTCSLGLGNDVQVKWEQCRDCPAIHVIEEPTDEEIQRLGIEEIGIPNTDYTLEWPAEGEDGVVRREKLGELGE